MNQGIKTVVYPVKDIARAKALFRDLLGIEPYADASYYVGFKVGNQDIGLDPNGHPEGTTAYYHVDDINKSLKLLVDAGAKTIHEIRNVGGGRLIASVKDADGNIIGLVQGVHAKHVRLFLAKFAILWRKQQVTAVFHPFLAACTGSTKSLTTFACTRSRTLADKIPWTW